MMLRNVIDEIVRRRLWPIAALAALIAVAAPLLFLKPSPPGVPAASATAAEAAPTGELPARARQLLSTSDAARSGKAARRSAKRRAADPFQAPASHAGKATAGPSGKAAKSSAAPRAADKPVPVVITNGAGSTQPAAPAPDTRSAGAPIGDRAKPTAATRPAVTVDVRFGRRWPTRLHRQIARTQTFVAGGRVIAIFVKYSPNRDKAVFAVAPTTLVTGLECRRKGGVCRYVDIPAGEHVRLTTLSSSGALVTRRLDVVRIGRRKSARVTAAAARSAAADGSCLLRKLLAVGAGDSPLAAAACKG